jgi:glycosyltransferase involved in cell wall biosynthesis
MAELVSDSTDRDCSVLPLGVDHRAFAPAAQPGDRVVCVADFYAHKRHDLMIDVWLHLPTPRPQLHFIGNPDADVATYARLVDRVRSLNDGQSVLIEHGLTLAGLVAAYQSARVFIMASDHESFCMPLAESMACGVPAVVRDLPSLRETGGSGARYVRGDDPALWAAQISRLISDDSYHASARRAAIEAASQFSWETFANALFMRSSETIVRR